MLWRLIVAERRKLKRAPIWIAFFLMPVIPALLGNMNYSYNIGILTRQWYSLWTQHTLFTSYIFLPVLVGVYCSYIMHEEETNSNWNRVLSMPVKRSEVFFAKLIMAACMVFLCIVWILLLFVLSGKILGLTAAFPAADIIRWALLGTLGGTVMAAVQLLLSLYIKGFAPPVGVALGGGLSGLLFLVKGYGGVWLYSLMAYGMNANSKNQLDASGYLLFVVVCILYIAAITMLGGYLLSKKDM